MEKKKKYPDTIHLDSVLCLSASLTINIEICCILSTNLVLIVHPHGGYEIKQGRGETSMAEQGLAG